MLHRHGHQPYHQQHHHHLLHHYETLKLVITSIFYIPNPPRVPCIMMPQHANPSLTIDSQVNDASGGGLTGGKEVTLENRFIVPPPSCMVDVRSCSLHTRSHSTHALHVACLSSRPQCRCYNFMRGSSKLYLDGNLVGRSWLHARILFQPLFNLICFFCGCYLYFHSLFRVS